VYKTTVSDPCEKHPTWPRIRCKHCTDYVASFDVNVPVRSKGSKSAWNYTHSFGKDDKVNIHSKKQFERECKDRGLVHVVKDDLFTNGQATKAKPEPIDRKLVDKTVKDLLPKAKRMLREAK